MSKVNKTKATLLIILISIFNSVISIGFNLVYNNLIIRQYGSEINGLVSTLAQFVSIFTLIEGGFTVAAIVASYEPIVQKDYKKLNDILYTTKVTFNKIALIFSIAVLGFGVIYTLYINSPLGWLKTYSLLVVTMFATSCSLSLYSRYQIVMCGHNKSYLQSIISIFSRTVTWCISIVLILSQQSIILVYSLNAFNVFLNVIILKLYELKYHPYVTYKGRYDKNLIKGTKDVLLQKIASCLFSSTDLILISSCLSLSLASVYNLYNQIFHAVFNFLASIVQAPFDSFGQLINEDNGEKVIETFYIYQRMMLIISTIIFTVIGMSILSFIKIYTYNVNDANYIYPVLVILFYAQFFTQFNNRPYGLLLNVSGEFKRQNTQCLLAAVVNLIGSIIMMKMWGISGVILGSFLGTFIILIMNVYQCYKSVLIGGYLKDILIILLNFIVGLLLMIIPIKHILTFSNYFIWAIYVAINMIIASGIILMTNFIVDRNRTMKSISFMFNLIKKRFVKN